MASGILEPTRTRDAQSLRNAPEKGRTVESRRQEPPESTPDRPASRQDGARDRSRPPSLLRRHLSWGTLALGLTSAAAFGGYSYWTSYIQPFESTDDAFVDARSFSVAPKVAGYVVDAPVTDNQHVAAGATLFQIDKRDYDTALAQANAQVEAGEAAIQTIDAQIDMQKAEIEVAQAQVTQAQAALAFAQQDSARYSDLAKSGYGSVQNQQSTTSTLQQRRAAVAQAQASLDAARSQIKTLQAQRASAQAQLAVATAQRDQARLNLGYTQIVAAQPGRLVRLSAGTGVYAQIGQSLAMFVPDQIWVTANFKESQVADMRSGQAVEIEIDAYPDRTITGRVESVQPGSGTAFSLLPAENATGNYVKVTQRIPVKIAVDQWPTDVAIGPGMSIVPTVHVR